MGADTFGASLARYSSLEYTTHDYDETLAEACVR